MNFKVGDRVRVKNSGLRGNLKILSFYRGRRSINIEWRRDGVVLGIFSLFEEQLTPLSPLELLAELADDSD